jgi:hypothetical protein
MRFSYVDYDDASARKSGELRDAVQQVEALLLGLPESRERSLALTKLEEAFMWTGKAIRNQQLEREAAS